MGISNVLSVGDLASPLPLLSATSTLCTATVDSCTVMAYPNLSSSPIIGPCTYSVLCVLFLNEFVRPIRPFVAHPEDAWLTALLDRIRLPSALACGRSAPGREVVLIKSRE